MKKILITTASFAKNNSAPLDLMTQYDLEYILNPYGRKLTESELVLLIEKYKPNYLIAGTEEMTSTTLDVMAPYVKMISRCGVGMDGIDLEYAAKVGIKVLNTPDAPTVAVAELTLGIMLDLLRGISKTDRVVRKGGFEKTMGLLLSGKVVGLIGCGRIGSHLATILKPLGCRIVGYDILVKQHTLIELMPLEKVVKHADILSLHIPYTNDTHHFINKKVLGSMKSTAYLINVSRGGIVNEGDLYEILRDGKIAGAGIDCYEKEPYSGRLTELDNVVLTSHIGSYARESRLKQEIDAVNNIIENM